MVAMLGGCDYTSSSGSESGEPAKSSGTTGMGSGETASPPGFSGAGGISGVDDSVVATASTSNLAVVVGASQTLSITFASSDGRTMTGFSVSGTLGGSLPAGWSGPTSFVCASVNTGSGCVLNLTYAPTAVDSGTLTVTYVEVDNAGMATTPISMTVAYVATANNNVVASTAPTGQVVGKVGGGTQSVSVDFFTDDGNPATNLSVTSDLTALPAGWSSATPNLSCAIVSTGNGCLLTLNFAPASSVSGTLTLNYSYTDEAGESKTGIATIPYFTSTANDVVATVSPVGEITAVEKTGGRSVPVTFTTNNGEAATNLSLGSSLKSLPAGWSAAAGSLSCAKVSTGSGCQLALTYAPAALGSGTLSLNYSYVDGSGAAKTGVTNIPYIATTNDNVVATPSQTGQITAVVGSAAVPLSVTFTTDDTQPATALQLTTDLSSLPGGWSSTASSFTCAAIDADASCVLPLSYAPVAYGSGMLTLGYSYINNAGLTKTGTLTIDYRAVTNDSIGGTASPASLSVRTGSSTPVTVTFVTSDGNPASALSLTTALNSLPAGWTSGASGLSCATVSAGTACTLSLTYAPTVAITGGSLNLQYAYTNDAGVADTGTVSIPYTSITPYLYVTNNVTGTVSSCPINVDNSLGGCATTGGGFATPYGIAFDGIYAYVANDVGTMGTLISECTLGASGTLGSCAGSGGAGFTSATAVSINPAGTYAYIEQSAGLDVCAVNGASGALSSCVITGSAYAPLAGFALSPDGVHAYAVHAANTLDLCTLATGGTIVSCAASPAIVTQAQTALAVQNSNLYVSTTAGALYVCALGSTGGITSCQTTGIGSNAIGIAFLGSTAYVSTNGVGVLVCPVNADGTLASCATDNDASFSGASGVVVH
jgi:hypothetical protein